MKIKYHIQNLLTPGNREDRSELGYWQERILRYLLFFCTVLGLITYFPSVALSIKESLWIIAVADSLIYFYVVALFFFPQIPYLFRAYSFILISYLLGLVLILVLGPYGAGPVWIFTFPVLTVLFLGLQDAIYALILNGLTVILIGLLILNGVMNWGMSIVNPIEKWGVTGINFMLLNTIVVLSVNSILKGLQDTLESVQISRKKYQRIFTNIQDVYYEEDIDGTLLEISPSIASITGFTPEDLLGKPFQTIYESPNQRDILLGEILTHGSLDNYELQIKDKNGTAHLCSVNARLIETEDGSEQNIVGIFRDITLQKQMAADNTELQAQLDRAKKMEALGLLAGGVAHDLNNILSSVVGYPELLLMDLDENSPLREPLLDIKSSGEKAAETIQDLLTLSRRGVTTREPVDMNLLVATFVKSPECRSILKYHPNCMIETQLNSTNPIVLGSHVHLSKTVMNLVSNAAEAQPNAGSICLTTRNETVTHPISGYVQVEPGAYVVLAVSDEGIGIAPQDQERIFEPFFTKKEMGRSGTGLGMAVVWGTIQDHGGFIDILSAPGKGTTFHLYFPESHRTVEAPVKAASFSMFKGNLQQILIVDDVVSQRLVAQSMLKKLNYQVSTVESGEKAIEFLTTQSVDLVILDMIMAPGMDGLETYRKILEIRPGQKAIIASGFSESDRVKEVMGLGASYYIKKPYALAEIGRAVRDCLAQPYNNH